MSQYKLDFLKIISNTIQFLYLTIKNLNISYKF